MSGIAGGGSGLSPRVRGNPKRIRSGKDLLGSIPACAGEPLMVAVSSCR